MCKRTIHRIDAHRQEDEVKAAVKCVVGGLTMRPTTRDFSVQSESRTFKIHVTRGQSIDRGAALPKAERA